jgi:hypothetical protein
MRALWLIALAACGGCVTYYPGDGHLVIVELDPAFSEHVVQDSGGMMWTEAEAIGQGIRFWDSVGAHLRTRAQLTLDDNLQAQSAPVLQVFRNDAIIGNEAGDYEPMGGIINLYSISLATVAPVVRDAAAHETGHAMGLGHVNEAAAVMYYYTHPSDGIKDGDCSEFRSHWSGPRCPPPG